MNKERTPHILNLNHGLLAWMPFDPNDKSIPEIISTKHGTLAWLPNSIDEPSAELNDIGTLIGRIFWMYSESDVTSVMTDVQEEIREIEENKPYCEVRLFLQKYLPLIFTKCLQDSARQALREAYAIVKAKGRMDYPAQRSKYLEGVADEARKDSLKRFGLASVYTPLMRGQRRRSKDTFEENLVAIIQEYFGDEQRIRKAIHKILELGDQPTPRTIARELKLGKPDKSRELDTGIKKVESILRKLRPGQTAGNTISEFVTDANYNKNQQVRKNSRRKSK